MIARVTQQEEEWEEGQHDGGFIIIYLFWLCWALRAAQAFLQLQSGDHSLVVVPGFSLRWLLTVEHRLQDMWAQQSQFPGSRELAHQLWHTGLVASQHVGVFPDQGSNPCLLHWQADSLPLSHQGSPGYGFKRRGVLVVFELLMS